MTPQLSIDRPFRRYGGVVAACLALAVLANAFAVYYVVQERYIYYWDWSHYWDRYRDLAGSLTQHPIATLGSLIGSIRKDDHNSLPVLPLVPVDGCSEPAACRTYWPLPISIWCRLSWLWGCWCSGCFVRTFPGGLSCRSC
ncbi:MAG: hypothetical protein M5R38_06775 [Candidatus Methylomirabilis sp.]|nr:hypothetical protein [Candidatus Methylomirabilis sp.]